MKGKENPLYNKGNFIKTAIFRWGGEDSDVTDDEGCPDYDPPQDPEPAPDGPSSPSSE